MRKKRLVFPVDVDTRWQKKTFNILRCQMPRTLSGASRSSQRYKETSGRRFEPSRCIQTDTPVALYMEVLTPLSSP